jgi:16S rRNA (guanine(966)-N(2))-methyltransferase RsmD
LRLTGGQGRGRRLASAAHGGLRPTAARVREALFDILGARVGGAAVLDLFAGTGAVGIDALSRGAGRVVFVEADPRAARLIAVNLRAAGLSGDVAVIEDDAVRALDRLAAAGESFGIVFLDPPYATGAPPAVLDRSAALVAAGGVLVVEHDGGRRSAVPGTPAGLRAGRRYRYGDSRLSVFHRDPPTAGRRG